MVFQGVLEGRVRRHAIRPVHPEVFGLKASLTLLLVCDVTSEVISGHRVDILDLYRYIFLDLPNLICADERFLFNVTHQHSHYDAVGMLGPQHLMVNAGFSSHRKMLCLNLKKNI